MFFKTTSGRAVRRTVRGKTRAGSLDQGELAKPRTGASDWNRTATYFISGYYQNSMENSALNIIKLSLFSICKRKLHAKLANVYSNFCIICFSNFSTIFKKFTCVLLSVKCLHFRRDQTCACVFAVVRLHFILFFNF